MSTVVEETRAQPTASRSDHAVGRPGSAQLTQPAEPPESREATAAPVRARFLIGLIRLYQAVRHGRPSPCRYTPSCSEYAAIALARHGVARGGLLAVRRLSRCHPWGSYGADPVPECSGVRNPS